MDGRQDQHQGVALQRAERDLDQHLGTVAALGHEFNPGSHRPRFRVVGAGAAVGRVARADRVGHEHIHVQADQFGDAVVEQDGSRWIGEHD